MLSGFPHIDEPLLVSAHGPHCSSPAPMHARSPRRRRERRVGHEGWGPLPTRQAVVQPARARLSAAASAAGSAAQLLVARVPTASQAGQIEMRVVRPQRPAGLPRQHTSKGAPPTDVRGKVGVPRLRAGGCQGGSGKSAMAGRCVAGCGCPDLPASPSTCSRRCHPSAPQTRSRSPPVPPAPCPTWASWRPRGEP